MKSFNVNTNELTVSFPCPFCGETIVADVSDAIPEPDWGAETASGSESSDSMEIECEECGAQFTIEIFKNIYEGNIRITYVDKDGHEQEIDDDIELEEGYYNDEE